MSPTLATPEHLALIAALLESISPSTPVPDTTLLQLHAVVGSTLVSALQLVDCGDVVKVSLPGGRGVYQVTASAGAPYTLYLDVDGIGGDGGGGAEPSGGVKKEEPPASNAPDRCDSATAALAPPPVPPPVSASVPVPTAAPLAHAAQSLASLYCPCTGFAYNALTGGRALFCKHILAVLLANAMGRAVETRVGLKDTAVLLGMGGHGR